METEERWVYVAKRAYGETRIAHVRVVKETDCFLFVDAKSRRWLTKSTFYMPARLEKRTHHFFATQADTLRWVAAQLAYEIHGLEKNLARCQAELEEVEASFANLIAEGEAK